MRILLLGEYSNVHATLADGLRALGHEVTVVSNGDFWKDYPRDIDVSRRSGKLGGIALMAKVLTLLPRLRDYDIVQLINPMFLELKAERLRYIYRYLRRHNRCMVLGAFGMDYYWVHENITRRPLRYSDFNIGTTIRNDEAALKERRDWLGTTSLLPSEATLLSSEATLSSTDATLLSSGATLPSTDATLLSSDATLPSSGATLPQKGRLSRFIARDCDAIVCGLYEYWAVYHPLFPAKTSFIPFPIKLPAEPTEKSFAVGPSGLPSQTPPPLCLFIGISRARSAYKGTDIMLRAARALQQRYPTRVELRVAEGVPFVKYVRMMQGADAILDQLYSYTPSMNPLEAMAHGIICIGGGEPENYAILGDTDLKPIVNVLPTYDSVYHELEQLVLHPDRIAILKAQSVEYIRRYHDYNKVAQQYLDFYNKLLCNVPNADRA